MKLKSSISALILTAAFAVSAPMEATVVYYDNSSTHWATPHIHYWKDHVIASNWPGVPMSNAGISQAPDLWQYDVPDAADGCLFNAGDGDATKTGDFSVADGAVYNHDGAQGSLQAYLAQLGGGDTPDDGQYTIWFDNTLNCPAVHAYVWDKNDNDKIYSETWPGTLMSYNAERRLFYFNFTCTSSDPNLFVIFNSTEGDTHQSDDLKLLNNFVYTHDGPQDLVDNYVVSNPSAPLGALASWENDGTTVTVHSENGTLLLTPWAPYIVKVFTLPLNAGISEERRSISVPSTPDADYSVSETDDELLISINGGLTVAVAKATSLVTFRNPDGNVILAEDKGLQNSGNTRKVSFLPANDDAFYGGGYNGGWTNWQDHSMIMNNTQTGDWDANTNPPHCITIPYFISSNGYGVYFDDHYRGATLTPSASGTLYSSSSLNPIAYYFIGGENAEMEQVMANYTLLTGRQDMPAYWGLGYITSRYGYHNRQEAENVVNSIKEMPLPLDAIVFDLYWQGDDEYHLGTLDWGSNFPDAKGMMKGFKDLNVHTICITEPYFTHLCPNYDELRSKGYFADESVNDMAWLHSNQVGLIDSSNPDAMDWMAGFYKARTHEGVDGWWMDLGEPERHDDDSNHMGGSVSQIHNEFSLLWQKAIYENMRAEFPDMRLLLMPRSGTAGMQHYSAFPWTGDISRSWEGLAAQVPALVNSSMSGIGYMGSDVGGFIAGNTNPELYLRWIEFAVFSPAMRTHSQYEPEPYLPAYSSVADGIRKFVNLRYRYLPYLYNLAYANSYKGFPLARPANFHDADHAPLADCKDAYLWGRDIFVAPVLSRGSSRQITFPDGEWIDMNNWKDKYTGGQTITYPAALDCLPHFARVGSFIPRYTDSVFTSTAEASTSDFTIDYIFDPNNPEATGFLYEDDHADPTPVENDNYILTEFSSALDENGGLALVINRSGTTHSNAPETHNYTIVVHNYDMPYEAAVFGGPVTSAGPARAASLHADNSDYSFDSASSPEDLGNASGNAYYYDPDNRRLHIRFSAAPTEGFVLAANNDGVLTGLETITGEGLITLGYVDGSLVYSIPDGYSNASASICNISGAEIAAISDMECCGIRSSISLDLPAGIYLAKVNATSSAGRSSSRNFKFIVK